MYQADVSGAAEALNGLRTNMVAATKAATARAVRLAAAESEI
ncbi:hypothetical protein GCM10029992_50330 [Glycomyces albus]